MIAEMLRKKLYRCGGETSFGGLDCKLREPFSLFGNIPVLGVRLLQAYLYLLLGNAAFS